MINEIPVILALPRNINSSDPNSVLVAETADWVDLSVGDLTAIGQFVLHADGSRTIQSSILDRIDFNDDEDGEGQVNQVLKYFG